MDELYRKLGEKNKEIQAGNRKGIEFYSHRHTVKALVKLKWRYRDIVGFYYENVPGCSVILPANRIDNKRLLKLISEWNTKGYIDSDKVALEIEKIRSLGETRESQGTVSVFSYSMMDLCKEIAKLNGGTIPDGQTQSIKAHYEGTRSLPIGDSARRWFEKYKAV